MLAILLIIVGGVAGYIYYSQVGSLHVTDFPPLRADANDSLSKFKDINFNFQIFDSASFRSLRVFGDSPVSPGSPGKQDLFAPF